MKKMKKPIAMLMTTIMVLSIATSALALLFGTGICATPEDNEGNITFALNAGPYEITEDKEGFAIIQMEGFSTAISSGDPMLPHKVYDIVVPPDVIWSSIDLKIISAKTCTLNGTYTIKPAPPDVIGTESGWIEAWGEGKEILNGKNMNIYGSNASYPEHYVKLLPPSQMRKWKFTRVDFTPYQYNPITQELTLIESVVIEISYERAGAMPEGNIMKDNVMDDIARETFFNYEEGKAWYAYDETSHISSSGTYNYVIITTNAIESGSSKLSSFVTHKQNLGYNVLVITEDEFGTKTGQAPDHRAEKIRKWLMDNWASMGIDYVLLIGDPHPYHESGIPMKMCWPNATDDYREAPTDYFYADLTGNWDKDGDTYYGEWGDDYGYPVPVTGGVDFAAEVCVGRIPVYNADYATLDNILQKTIDYETEGGSPAWRKNILLPMGFQYPGYDGAMLAEQMKADYLDAAGFSSYRMYQQGSGACGLNSIYTSEQELRGGTAVRNHWAANGYGVVCWWGHGNETGAYVGYDGCWDLVGGSDSLFLSSYCSSLDDDLPAFTFQCSCENGYPENSNNLQYAILKHGGIGTVSATRVSSFNTGVTKGEFDGSTTNSGIGYEYVKRLVANNPAGESLYLTKKSMSPGDNYDLLNFYVFNLYGDPSVYLLGAPDVWVDPTSFDVTLPPDAIYSTNLTIGNDGNGTLTFEITDVEGSSFTGVQESAAESEFSGVGLKVLTKEVKGTIAGDNAVQSLEVASGEHELAYDDGVMDDGWAWSSAGCAFGVHFTSPADSTLTAIKFYIGSELTSFDWKVRSWTGSQPGSVVIASGTTTPTFIGWHEVDVGSISVPSDFVIAIYWKEANRPTLGCDYDQPDYRSWNFNNVKWSSANTVDYMIRAVISEEEGWLSEFPTGGAVESMNQTTITVTFNTTGLSVDDYYANITITNNDPDENPVIIPVHLTVLPPEEAPSVTVLYPNGGDSIPVGTQVTVSAHATDDTEVTGVTFSYSSNGGSNWNPIGAGTRVSGTVQNGTWNRTWNTNGLTAGSNYLLKAVASDGALTAEDQSNSTFTLTPVPPAPTISSTTHPNEDIWYNNNDPSFTWTTPSDTSGIAGYSYIIDHSSSTIPDTTVNTTGNSKSYTDLSDGTWYFHVRAKNNAGNWGSTDHYRVKINTTIPPPPQRTITFYTDPTNGGTITFDGSTYSNGQSTSKSDSSYSVSATPTSNYVFDHWTTTGGVSVANQYSQSTTATVSGNGSITAWFTCVPPATPVLNDPGTNDTDGNYLVSWSSVSGATSYTLEEDTTSGFSSPNVYNTGSSTSKEITGKGNGTYYYRAKACNACGCSGWSTVEDIVVEISPSCVIYVPSDYPSIQAAVGAAINGCTIIVRDGTYTENVKVIKQLVIKSENGSAKCLVRASNDHVFEVTADYVTISGFTIQNATGSSQAGVYLSGAEHCEVADNNVSGNYYGILLVSSSKYNMLMGNTANLNDYYGIWLGSSSYNNLTGNTANSNNNYGIYLSSSSYNNLTGNTASNNDYGIRLYYSYSNTLKGNTANSNNNYGIYLNLASYNRIYNNYFNNTNNAYDNSNNFWNITKTPGTNIIDGPNIGGNYWSDYTGEDTNGDGLGDTPYDVPGGTNKDYLPLIAIPAPHRFDTDQGTYPSISGTFTGTIKPSCNIPLSRLYTYPCPGTGGHTEYAQISNQSWSVETLPWNGYTGDWHNITFNNSFTLYANETYNYTIRTGSYPQIIHGSTFIATDGVITCTGFTDANGKTYADWIPAIKLE